MKWLPIETAPKDGRIIILSQWFNGNILGVVVVLASCMEI